MGRPREETRWQLPKSLRQAPKLLLLVLVAYLLVPQLAGIRQSWHLIATAAPHWIIIGLALEFLALAAYGWLTTTLVASETVPLSWWSAMRIDLSTLAVSHVIPAGSAAGLGLGYRLLTQAGVPGADAVAAKAEQAVGSAVVLNLLLLGGLLWAAPTSGFSSLFGVAALVAAALLAFAAGAVVLLMRGEARLARWLGHLLGRLPRLTPERIQAALHAVAGHLRRLAGEHRRLASTAVLAALNWLLDAAALWCCVRAFGYTTGLDGLLVSYGVAGVLAAIPFTPGGVGIVEAFLIPTLVGFGAPRGIAILGVLAWRGLSFVLPIPLGLLAYLSLSPAIPEPEDAAEAP